jgi:hypothetical protein
MIKTTGLSRRRSRQRGTEFIEFGLSALVLFPIMIGVVMVGLNLGRSVRISQLCRDVGSMYVRGVDFSADPNKDIVVRLNQGMGMTRTGGTGVVIMSKVKYIPASDCVGIVGACNSNQYVVIQRLTIGNTAVQTSRLGPSGAPVIDSFGNVTNYLTDSRAVTSSFSGAIMTLAAGEYAYVTETFFPSMDLTDIGAAAGSGVYSRAVF